MHQTFLLYMYMLSLRAGAGTILNRMIGVKQKTRSKIIVIAWKIENYLRTQLKQQSSNQKSTSQFRDLKYMRNKHLAESA